MSTETATVPLIPETAPFAPAQRAWLNGFFAGIVTTGPLPTELATTSAADGESTAASKEPESFPWHDSAIPLADRLKMAEGKPQERVLMAAMAQLDCGSCGYNCQRYAKAIADGVEKDLTRCSPGGRETARALKQLVASCPPAGSVASAPAAAAPAVAYDRSNPFPARFRRVRKLSGDASSKDVRHVVIDIRGSGLSYKPGDSLGVFVENCPQLVQSILDALAADGSEHVAALDGSTTSLRQALLRDYAIRLPSLELVCLLGRIATVESEAQELNRLALDENSCELERYELLDLLAQFPSARPTPADFISALSPLQPRLYSISSSPRVFPDEVHLTVGVVSYHNGFGRLCRGVASNGLGERMKPGDRVRVFVHAGGRFTLPTEDDVPIIMIGPGTGIAPFIAFLQERKARKARGMNWLFFGDQHEQQDYLYRAELQQFAAERLLTRLDTAFSRDQQEKIYVQHRMLEKSADIWSWITSGACIYVCGDAKRMAADADAALRQIVMHEGKMSEADAGVFMEKLSANRRYMKDVY